MSYGEHPATRTIVGTLGVLAAAGLIVTSIVVEPPTLSGAAPAVTIDPEPADQVRVCSGGVLTPSGQAGTEFSASGSAQLTRSGNAEDAATLEGFNVGGDDDSRRVLRSAPSEPIAGSVSQAIDSEEYTGLVASSCAPARAESWLVGGSTETGRDAQIVLSNPGETDASADLAFFSENGEIQAPGATGVIVPAGQTRVLPLSAYVTETVLPVIQVVARGSELTATLQSSSTRGLDRAGIDIAAASATASTTQTISGVVIGEDVGVAQGEEFDDQIPAVRVFAPHATSASVSIVIARDGEGGSPPRELTLVDATVGELSLESLAEGEYSITLTSDVPVVAAARTTAVSGDEADFSWVPSSAVISGSTVFSVPENVDGRLHVTNASESETIAVLTNRRGDSREVVIAAGNQESLRVDDGASYRLEGTGISAAVSVRADAGIAAFPVYPASIAEGSLTVYPQ